MPSDPRISMKINLVSLRAYKRCPKCIEYAEERMSVLAPAMADLNTGETSQQILDRYMAGVHQRHLSGLPILPERVA